MKKLLLWSALSLLFLSPLSFANECVDHISDRVSYIALDLSDCQLNDNNMQAVADFLQINPTITQVYLGYNNLTGNGVAYLKDIPITLLVISNNNLGDYGASVIAQFSSLEDLVIDGNKINDEGAIALGKNKKIGQLRIGNNNLTGVGVSALVTNTGVWNLLMNNSHFDTQGLTAISNDPLIRWLDVRDSNLSPNDTIVLMKNLNSLEGLSIDRNPIGDQGIAAIAKKPKLWSLDASGCSIGSEGAIALSNMTSLSSLELSYNHIDERGTTALAKLKLGLLMLDANSLFDEGVAPFSDTNIPQLSIRYNNIENAGALALSKNKHFTYLDVAHNRIGKKGITALKNSGIQDLNTEGNVSSGHGLKPILHSSNPLNKHLAIKPNSQASD